MRARDLLSPDQPLPPAESIARFASEVSRGHVRDVATLLRARKGPVEQAEIDALNQELQKIGQPRMPAMRRLQTPDMILVEIKSFGQKRKVLSDYRQILYELSLLALREASLASSSRQLAQIRKSVTKAASQKERAALQDRIGFWQTAVSRDLEAIHAIEARLSTLAKLPLSELRALVDLDPRPVRPVL